MPPTGKIKSLIEDCLAETIEGNMHLRAGDRAAIRQGTPILHPTVHQQPAQQSRS